MDVERQEFLGNRWWVVVGSLIALTTSSGSVFLFGFSLFVQPLTTEFGWSRATISASLSIGLISTAVAYPFAGYLVDRFGLRRVTLMMIVLFGLAMAAISLTAASPVTFWALYAVAGIFGAGHSTLQYAKAVSGWFDRNRGLALGIAMAGSGLGAIFMPQLIRVLITTQGWRAAYIGLGIVIIVVGFTACALFIRDPPVTAKPDPANGSRPDLAGMEAREAVTTFTFWGIALAVFLASMVINGIIAHAVPILTDRGVPAETAASMLFAVGFGALVGRIGSGFVFDYVFAPYVSAGIFVIALLGVVLLMSGAGGPAPLLAMACFGLSLGSEVDLVGYLTGRYFGLRRYGTIYGYFFSIFALSSAIGPLLLGVSFDLTQSYNRALVGFLIALVVAIILVLRLGPYRFAEGAREDKSKIGLAAQKGPLET